MKLLLRHIFFLAGICIALISFLYFGREQGTYLFILVSGLFIVAISILVILFKKDSIKNKLIWVGMLVFIVFIEPLVEPLLIKKSYNIFITQNLQSLTQINSILGSKSGEIWISQDSGTFLFEDFNDDEAKQLRSLITYPKFTSINKNNKYIFYRTFSMLDVESGVYYFFHPPSTSTNHRHIFGNWYF